TDIKIFASVTIEIAPSGTHPSSNILHACFRSNISKGAVPIVSIQIFSTEIISYKQIRPAIIVIVSPGTGKTVTVVVLIKAGLLGHVLKSAVSAIAVHDIWRTVPGIVVRTRYLSRCCRPAIGADVKVQETVMIIIGQGCRRHGPLSGSVGRECGRRN